MRLLMDTLRHCVLSLGLLGGVTLVGTIGYVLVEHWGLFESFYQTMVVVSTLGMRQVRPMSRGGEVVTLFLIVGGVGSFTYFFTSVARMLVEGQIRGVLGRRMLDSKIRSLKGHFIICGYGRMGQTVAAALAHRRLPVVVIDQNPEATASAEAAGVLYVLGNAHEEETLTRAHIVQARGVISVLPTDADNVFVALTARGLCPGILILTQGEHPSSEAKLRKAGADRVFNPYMVGASRFTAMITHPTLVEFIDGASQGVNVEVQEIAVSTGSPVAGLQLRDSKIRERAGVQVIAVRKPDGSTVFTPEASYRIEASDILVCVGGPGSTDRLEALVNPGRTRAPEGRA